MKIMRLYYNECVQELFQCIDSEGIEGIRAIVDFWKQLNETIWGNWTIRLIQYSGDNCQVMMP